MALAEVRTLNAQRGNELGHACTLRSKKPGFQTSVAEGAEKEFSAFCRRLPVLLSDLVLARRLGVSRALNESMASHQEIIAAFKA